MTPAAPTPTKVFSEAEREIAKRNAATLKNSPTLYQYRGLTKKHIDTFYYLAYNFYTGRKYQEAVSLFRGMVMYDHTDKRGWMGLGASYQMLKNYQGAIAAYSYAALLDPNDPMPVFHSLECYLSIERYQEALAAIDAVIFIAGDKPEYMALKKKVEGMHDVLKKTMQENKKSKKE